MEYDTEGFLSPRVAMNDCIRCGKCVKACPMIDCYKPRNNYPKTAYAVMANDEIRYKSSSGGIFTLCADEILKQGGVICGAAFDEDFRTVKHIIVNNNKDLEKLRKSKYVQSDIGNVYSDIKILLEKNKIVLFTGCPCQVDGLYSFLGKDYSTLYTLDLICHGVPPPRMWTEFVDHIRKGQKITSVDFRSKEKGWTHSLAVSYNTGEKYAENRTGLWSRAFLSSAMSRKSCSRCKYANMQRSGDLTIGDFWGAKKHPEHPNLDDEKGTSVVLCNNEKGAKLLEVIKTHTKLFEEVSLEFSKKGNRSLIRSSCQPIREKCMQKYSEHGDTPVALKFIATELDKIERERAGGEVPEKPKLDSTKKYDVCLYSMYFYKNFGSQLNFFSVYKAVTDMGLRPLVLRTEQEHSEWLTKNWDLLNLNFEFSKYRPPEKFFELCKYVKTFAICSDNFWPFENTARLDSRTLGFVDDNTCRRISLATSVRPALEPKESFDVFSRNLKKFDYITVREQPAINFIKKEIGLTAEKLIDPVFWHDAKVFDEIISRKKHKPIIKPYVLGVLYHGFAESMKFVRSIKEWKQIDMKTIFRAENHHQAEIAKHVDDTTLLDIDVSDFLYYIKNAEFVVANSFHAACFAIIFNKPFICAGCGAVGRYENILDIVGLRSRLYHSIKDVYGKSEIFDKINWEKVNKILAAEKDKAIATVRKALGL